MAGVRIFPAPAASCPIPSIADNGCWMRRWPRSLRKSRRSWTRHVRWSYAELAAQTNRICHVLTDELGIVPGNRVLLRGGNSPLMFAVVAGGDEDGRHRGLDHADAAGPRTAADRRQGEYRARHLRRRADGRTGRDPVRPRRCSASSPMAAPDANWKPMMAAKAGPVPRRPHQPGRCLPDRLYLRHHRRAQGDPAFSSRRAGHVRNLRPAYGRCRTRRDLHRHAVHRVHFRAGRPSGVPALFSRRHRLAEKPHAHRPGRSDRAASRDACVHLADRLPGDDRLEKRVRSFQPEGLRLGGRSFVPSHFRQLVRGHRPPADRRHRRHRNDPYLHLRKRR